MITLVPLADPPHPLLENALDLLPREQFQMFPPAGKALSPGETIVILSDRLERVPTAPETLPPGCPAVFSGQNQAAAQFAAQAGLIPLDCGLSLRDTLTLSSVTEASAMVSLQRPITRLDGGIAEPVDLPLTLTRPWEPFCLLSCAGVLLLAGGAGALEKAKIF